MDISRLLRSDDNTPQTLTRRYGSVDPQLILTPYNAAGAETVRIPELLDGILRMLDLESLQRMRRVCRSWKEAIDGGRRLQEAQYILPPLRTSPRNCFDGLSSLQFTINPLLNRTIVLSCAEDIVVNASLGRPNISDSSPNLCEDVLLTAPPTSEGTLPKLVCAAERPIQRWRTLGSIEEQLLIRHLHLPDRAPRGRRVPPSEWGASWKSRLFCTPPISELMICDERTGWGYRCRKASGEHVLLGDVLGALEDMDMFSDPVWLAAQTQREWELELHLPLYDERGKIARGTSNERPNAHRNRLYRQLITKLRVRLADDFFDDDPLQSEVEMMDVDSVASDEL